PLLAQRLTERVDFTEGEAERVVIGPRARGPERVVAFEERGKEVRQRLDRADHAVAEHGHERPPADDDEERQRPPDPWLVVTEPEEGERDDGARRAGQEREERDVSLIAEAPSAATGIGIGGWHHRFRLRRSRLRARPRPDHGEIPYCWSRRYNALRLRPSWAAARRTVPPCRSSARRIRCFSTSSSVISSRRTAAASVARGRSPRSSTRMTSPVAMRTARSMACSSSRTLPGQECAASWRSASGSKPRIGLRYRP